MTTVILIAVRIAVVLTVLALGMSASFGDATSLFRRPAKLASALFSMNVVMPLFTLAMTTLFDLRPTVALALVALSVAPIPPILPRKAMSAGGGAAYTIGLLASAAVFAIVFVPLALFGIEVHVPIAKLAFVIALTVLAPLAVGMTIHRFAPRFAARAAKPTSVVALVLLGLCGVPVFIVTMPLIVTLLGNGTLAAIVAFNVVGLAAGHLLGGPDRDERSVLALTTASRHPGVAFVIALANGGEQKPVVAALLLYLLVNALVSLPYVLWSKRHHQSSSVRVQVSSGL